MSEIHTVVIEFEDGKAPVYSQGMNAMGGKCLAVNFYGDKLEAADELEQALDDFVTSYQSIGCPAYLRTEYEVARKALSRFRGES